MNDAFWDFVRDHLGDDPNRLRLKYHGKTPADLDIDLAIVQIECRRRFGKKLAETLDVYPRWLFPSVLSGEQSTSDRLAKYHATLISEGDKVADLTAGLGIDTWHLAVKAGSMTAVEIDPEKADALRYNLSSRGIAIVNADCQEYITCSPDCAFDTLFIDPARRAEDGRRVFALSDCQPDITSMLPQFRRVSRRLIVKMSPMLDITHTLRLLPDCSRIIALGTETECKELIAVVDLHGTPAETTIEAVTIKSSSSGPNVLTFTASQERELKDSTSYAVPAMGGYLYDPYPAVMKAAPYNILQSRYGVSKLHPNTHLYTSTEPVADFPGQCMEIVRVIPYNSKYIKRLHKEYPRISVSVRNFDLPADRLRTKLGVSDGGDHRLIGVTLADGSKAMLLCKPLS